MEGQLLEGIYGSGFSFDWLLSRYAGLSILKNIPQNPEYHREGDVYCHTQMVCKELVNLPEWSGLEKEEQELLFLAAAFHDIGKAACTKQEDGKWVSPKHTLVGEKIFRRLAYREAEDFGLTFWQRETVAKLIRYHGMPLWFWTKKRMEFDLLKAAESIPLRLLYLLSKADVQGRIVGEAEQMGEHVELFADYARETGVWEAPYAFAENSGGMAVISLDNIRGQLGVPPTKGTGRVVQIATDQAREYLRRKEPFIWNATNLIQETRRKLVGLFAGYGARVLILYLEAPYKELLARNRKRARHIPENVLEEMLRKLELPAPWEAYEVRWLVS